jgi:hypothetical protein
MKERDGHDKKGSGENLANGLEVTTHERALVRHLARMAAEKDYKSFLKNRKIPYTSPQGKGTRHD